MSDREDSLKAIAKDFSKTPEHKETVKWLEGLHESDEKKYPEKAFGAQFRFQTPESAELNILVQRLQKVITYSNVSLRQANLSLSHITTIMKGLQCVLSKIF